MSGETHSSHRERHQQRRERHDERRAERRERHQQRRDERHDGPVELDERRARRRERRRADTRDEILTAAREVMLERGATELSLREIARRAGFSAGALYKYFDSKQDLIVALGDKAMRALVAEFDKVPPDLPPDERAVELGMEYLAFARENPEDVAIITIHEGFHLQPPTADHERLEDVVAGVFRDGIAQGVFAASDEGDAAYLAYGAWAFVLGLSTLELRQPPELSAALAARQRQLLQVYVNGLKAEGAGAG
ncbi:MAG TPA: TetR/AcrR family transcriptional regulator [Thermoleophilia bacterium]|nr:TetR/AcrR family transcriptional regulator [Thermoleophilia bacterium]